MDKKSIWKIVIFLVISLVLYGIFSTNVGDIFSTIVYLVSVLSMGIGGALAVSIISPILANLFGILGAELSQVLFPLIIANVLLVLGFWVFTKKIFDSKKILGSFLGILVGSIIRAIPITIGANNLAEISTEVRNALGFPQFASALVGGLILWIVYIILSKTNNIPEWLAINQEEQVTENS